MRVHGFSWVFMVEILFGRVLDHFQHGDPHGPMDPWCGTLYICYAGVPYITHPHGIHDLFHSGLDQTVSGPVE